ncbi:serine carboxypeptidase-like protein 51 [Tanacetum coccineum]
MVVLVIRLETLFLVFLAIRNSSETSLTSSSSEVSWVPLLKYVSRIDDNGFSLKAETNSLVDKIKQQIAAGKWKAATGTWGFHNFLPDSGMHPVSMIATELVRQTPRKRYSRYLDSLRTSHGENGDLGLLMNGAIRKKLGIIPDNVEWGGQSGLLDVICATKGTAAWVEKLKWEGLKTFL